MADEEELTQQEKTTIDRRLLQGNTVIYPITRQENIINLQKTIKEKLPIISASEPQEGFVNRQAWIDIGDGTVLSSGRSLKKGGLRTTRSSAVGASLNQSNGQMLSFGSAPSGNQQLSFGSSSSANQQLSFGGSNK